MLNVKFKYLGTASWQQEYLDCMYTIYDNQSIKIADLILYTNLYRLQCIIFPFIKYFSSLQAKKIFLYRFLKILNIILRIYKFIMIIVLFSHKNKDRKIIFILFIFIRNIHFFIAFYLHNSYIANFYGEEN